MAADKFVTVVVELLIQSGVANSSDISGCEAEEIARIEQSSGSRLPEAYRQFLEVLGRSAGRFFVGTDVFYPAILGLTEDAREIVAEDPANVKLPDDAIVFSMHQGYEFMFVCSSGGDDPPVFYYREKSGRIEKQSERFSEYMIEAAGDDW